MTIKDFTKRDLCYASSGCLLNRNIASTGFCVDSDFLQNDCIDEQAEMYLLNSKIDANDSERVYTINKYLRYPFTHITALSGITVPTGLEQYDLPRAAHLEMNLDTVIKQRKSNRKFSGDFIPLNYLSAVLRAAQGVTHSMQDNADFVRTQRSYPSGGGLYPVKLYVFANRVRKLDSGIYHYDPLNNNLLLLEKDPKKMDAFMHEQNMSEFPNIKDTAFVLFFTIESWKSISKYGSAGVKFCYIEVGEISQSAHLSATCLGLASCAYASFDTGAVNQLLNIDGDYESFQHAILFGISSEE